MKRIAPLLLLAYALGVQAQPVITAFNPQAGPTGTTVTIDGSNFDPVAANNVVYFGATRATVTGGNSSQLTVTVPLGSTYKPITVTSSGLTGYSAKPFLVTYPGSSIINTCAFSTKVDFAAGTTGAGILIADIDGDGKSELLSTNPTLNVVSILRNTATAGSINAGSFAPKIDIPTGVYPFRISADDFDGDGKLDLVVVNANDNSISVLRNTSTTGTISFAGKQDFPTGVNSRYVAVADFDGDGRPDIAVPNTFSLVSLFRNTSSPGNISFNPKTDFTTGANPSAVAAADFDGDGRPEIVTAGISGTNKLSVLKNNSSPGSLAFSANVDFTAANSPIEVAAGDVDGDGLIDLVATGNVVGVVSVLRNTGTPGVINTTTFASKVDFTAAAGSSGIALEDLDGNGKLDIVSSSNISNLVSLFRNTSTPGIINASSFAPRLNQATGLSPQMVVAGDLDGDGRPEFVTNNSGTNLGVFRNTIPLLQTITSISPSIGPVGTTVTITGTNFHPTPGFNVVSFSGTFSPTTGSTATTVTTTVPAGATTGFITIAIACATVTSPSVFVVTPDITYFAPVQGEVGSQVTIYGSAFSFTPANNIVYFGATRATVNSASSTQLTVTVPPGATYEPISVSVSGAIAYSDEPFLVTFPNGGLLNACSFEPVAGIGTSGFGYGPAVGDLDGDGKPDAAITDYSNGMVRVYRNTSIPGSLTAASFASSLDLASGVNPYFVDIVEIDGDGKLDLIVTNFGSNTLSVFRNTSTPGTISFASKVDLTTNNGPYQIATGDLNGDGRTDIAISNANSGGVSIWENVGSPGTITPASFNPKFDLPMGSHWVIAIRDLDLDGKPDLISGPALGTVLTIFENVNSGGTLSTSSFAAGTNFTVGAWPEFIAVGDLDNDLKPDIVTSSWPDGKISVLRNTSSPGTIDGTSFAPKVEFATGSEPRGVEITDFDGDGLADIALANQINNQVWIYKNQTTPGIINTGSFAAPIGYTAGGNLRGVKGVDFDGDGKPDLAVGNWGNPSLTVLRNDIRNLPTITGFAPLSGSVGTTITITGTNFSPNLASNVVTINGATAFVTAATATTLTVVIPANATTGVVNVSVNCQGPASGPVFTVNPLSYNACSAVTLTGSSDYIQISRNASLEPASLTWEALVNFSSIPTFGIILAKPDGTATGDSYAIWYFGGQLLAGVRIGGFIGLTWTPTIGQWYHIALTYNSTTQVEKLYIDGIMVASSTSLPPVYASDDLLLGADVNNSVHEGFFNGKLDEVRLWDKERTPLEIVTNLTATLDGGEPGLIAYYRIGETGQGSGITVANSASATGSINNGVTVGTATTPVFQANCSCVPPIERQALIALYNATLGSSWTNKTNWLSGDESTWYGVTVTSCHITDLVLDNNNLVGTIPTEIENLPELNELTLSFNQLSGALPASITNLANLRYLYVDNNSIGGDLPADIGNMTSLLEIVTQNNAFTGPIPASLINCTALQNLHLEGNQHTGTIPAFLGTNLFNLQSINLGFNQFDGDIPSELGNLANLTYLSLAGNQLTGIIPTELGNLDALELLDLSRNHLNSQIPTSFSGLSSLKSLQLWSNYLFGSVPNEIGTLSSLQELNLESNYFDDLPTNLNNLSQLRILFVGHNQFFGDFPATIGSLPFLEQVSLAGNQFTSIPTFTSPALVLLAVEDNALNFGHLEPNIAVATFTYSPQQDLPPGGNISFTVGGTLTIPFTTAGTANSYQWYRSLSPLPGATSATLVRPGMLASDYGFYTVTITSSIVPGLVLRSQPYVVTTNPCGPGGPDGSLDYAFDPMNTMNTETQVVLVQSDGKIIVSTSGMTINSVDHYGIIRFNADGTIDNTFNERSTSPQNPNAMVLQPDDKILFNDVGYAATLTRLNSDGTEDVAFSANAPSFFDGAIYALGLQPDGKILVSHADYMSPQSVTRYNNDGTTDFTFTELTDMDVSVIRVQADGKILLGGDFPGGIMRINTDGSPDPTFELDGADGVVSDILVQPDGKIVVVGDFVSFKGVPAYRIARINADGTSDPGFTAIGITDVLEGGPVPTRLGLQSDGKIIVTGPFETFNGATRPSILRLNTDGSIDCSFDGGIGADNTIIDVAVAPAGIFIVGNFRNFDDETWISFAKLHNSVFGSCVPAVEHNALVALYNSTAGAGWTDKTNWLSADESTWFGVTVAGCHVTDINLVANNLVGVIPPEIGDLAMLQELRLNTNQLSGSIPTQLGNLSNLYILNLQENQLSGTIPVSFGNLNSLGFLEAQSNQLTGSIPPEVGNATSIVFLRLSNNQLTGPIPTSFQNLTGLYLLEISQNQLSGPIPPELGTLASMKFLNINDNQLSGPIPPQLGNLLLLEDLNLYNNQFTGSLPVELAQCVNLKRFGGGNNQFTGTLPKEYGSWTNLTDFGIYRNMITGAVPPEYLSWTNAIRLYFDHNQIDAIPSFTASTITELNVNDNLLEFGDLEPNISVTGFAYSPQADLPGGNITVNAGSPLTIPFSTTGTANQYQWFKNSTLIPGATSSTFSIASAALTDAGNYSVEITNTIVTGLTLRSLDFVVSITPVINIVQQPADVSVCEGATATFTTNANGTTNINYQWQYSPDGVVPFVDLSNGGGYTNVSTSVLSVNTTGPFGAGRYRCRINGDLAVEVITNDEGLFINAVPGAPTATDAASCSSTSLTLMAAGGSPGEYRWYTTSVGGTALAGEVNDTYVTPVLTTTTTFFVALNNGTCESGRTPVNAAINSVAKPTVLTSNCTATGATLTGPGGFSSYAWSDGSTNASDIITVAGSYTLTVTSSLGCVSPPSDPVVFTSSFCNQPPVLQATTVATTVQAVVTIDLSTLASDLDNNLDPNSFAVISQPISGAPASINSNAELKVDYTDVSFAGTDQLTVQVCDILAACVQQTITIEVAGDLTVFNALSPNNDGKNEVLYIQYIDVLPDTKENKVTIFDRWGNPVFDVTNYDNINRVFRGLSNSGSELPPGTYYYVIDFASGTPRKTGFISLRR